MTAPTRTLAPAVWTARRAAHEARVDAWLGPVRERAARGEKHPVEDFLFTYYSQRPSRLRRWSPGAGVVLLDAEPVPPLVAAPGGATVGPAPAGLLRTADRIVSLLEATAARPPSFGCFGLHEWAMVHGQTQDDVRHAGWPLRLGAQATTDVVDAATVRCSHFDAFRFFTPSARPLNAVALTRESQARHEQPGCLHAGMDLYGWAYRLAPQVPSELVADAFDLARRIRHLDMRASPYDLSGLGYPAVRIEEPEGRAEYVQAQRAFAAEGAVLRERVLAAARTVLRAGANATT